MTLSLADLPFNPDGAIDGLWLFRVREALTTQMATAELVDGKTIRPVNGLILKRFVVGMGSVVGAVRVEGEPCQIGDVTGLVEPKVAIPKEVAPAQPALASEASKPEKGKPKGEKAPKQ